MAVARRIINNRTYFFCADDMGGPANERKVKDLLSTAQTDSIFNPQDSIWVSCNNICYRPHSNECGPRSLLALAVMLTHPNPCQNMLIPYMHQNITQEARLWVASLILQGKIDINTHHPPVTQNIRWSSLSIPYYGYARADRKTAGRESITAKLVANLIFLKTGFLYRIDTKFFEKNFLIKLKNISQLGMSTLYKDS